MAVAIEVTIDDLAFRSALQPMRDAGADLSPALRAIGEAMVTSTRLRFASGTGPDGAKWKPSKRALKEGGQTLVLSRRLESSIMANATSSLVEWGTNVIYAAIHQLGGVINRAAGSHTIYRKAGKDGIAPRFVKKRQSNFAQDVAHKAFNIKIPARPFLGVDVADQVTITDILTRHLAKALGGAA